MMYAEPPYSIKVQKGKIVAKVQLHRIPEELINVFVGPQALEVDTLKWSKKLQLKCVRSAAPRCRIA